MFAAATKNETREAPERKRKQKERESVAASRLAIQTAVARLPARNEPGWLILLRPPAFEAQ